MHIKQWQQTLPTGPGLHYFLVKAHAFEVPGVDIKTE